MPDTINHALVLNFHQPTGNLEHLLTYNEWEAKEILWALDRIPRALWGYDDVARIHVAFSGTLLETLSNPEFQSRVFGIVKCGDLLWHYQNTNLFEILGTAYYHPVLPLTPKTDWHEQCSRWQGIGQHLFWRKNFSGFWPPEMGFTMELIPHLRKWGYRYVLVDSKHVEPLESMRWEEIRYRPHIARYGDDEIVVVVRDRELSDAQESGMEWEWFSNELYERTKWCDFPPLVTTCTDGDNGGWFRNATGGNFWELFYKGFLEKVRSDETAIRPTSITDYLDQYGAKGYVHVNTGAWNTGWHNGVDFIQWTGSYAQKKCLQRVQDVSSRFHQFQKTVAQKNAEDLQWVIDDAHWHLLCAETSCNFYWGEAWVDRCHKDLDIVERHLDEHTIETCEDVS